MRRDFFFCQTLRASFSELSGRHVAIALLGVLDASLLCWGSEGSTAQQLIAVLAAASVGTAALIWIALDERFARTPLVWIVGVALLLRLIAVSASPLLEDDHYRYLWDGFRTLSAFDPYHLPPTAFFGDDTLPLLWQDVLSGINNPAIPTLYGPVLQYLFALASWFAPGQVGAIQALLLLIDMAVLALLIRQGVGARGLLVYALHPLILKEAMASAHPDGLIALLLLLAWMAWQQRRALALGAVLGIAVATKVSALAVLPLCMLAPQFLDHTNRQRWMWCCKVLTSLGLVLSALYLPFILTGGSDVAALGIFGEQWRFNPLLFRFVDALVPGLPGRVVAALLIIATILMLMWRQARAQNSGAPPCDSALVALLLLAPVVNAWYWLWALPLSLQRGRVLVASVACVSVLAYLNSTVLCEVGYCDAAEATGTAYYVPWVITVLQLAIVALAWRRDHLKNYHTAL